jgi:PAS domain S-box-containing protein/putative nucleotidyltransferase with HDIG domain
MGLLFNHDWDVADRQEITGLILGDIMGDTNRVKKQLGKEVQESRGRIAEWETIEDRQKRAEEALRESEEKFRNLAEQLPNMIFINTKGRVVYVNEKCEEILGYKRGEIYSPDFDFLILMAPEFRDTIKTNFSKPMKGEEVPSFEGALLSKEGKRIEAIWTTKMIDYGNEKAILAIVTDITPRKLAEKRLEESLEKLRRTMQGVIQAMALTVEIKDPYTAGHQRRVADLARAIATEMTLSKEQVEGIWTAGAIHDIGKITVPAEILSKPGKLDDYEFRLIKNHAQVGYDILKEIEFPWPIAKIVYQHHERMDGSGYPRGLFGDNILLEARILAVADVVEAMVSSRPYRQAHVIKKAMEEISKNRGILYDSQAADACLKLFTEKKFKFK